ncbi:MAG TPA: hypothetical protein VEA69_22365 [Tepidisphaeraceae bacterium]|nr:hypothetical protein [Tepidisphaeraceae bacterium]
MARSAFNELCRIAERQLVSLPEWKGFENQLRDLKLFTMPGNPSEFLPKEYTADQVELHSELFFLPFREIAVEDDFGVVLLSDRDQDASGLWTERSFFVLVAAAPDTDVRTGMAKGKVWARFTTGGTVFETKVDVQWAAEASPDGSEITVFRDPDIPQPAMDMAREHVAAALQEVMLLNTPSRFVVEQTPAKQRKQAVRIPRREDRPAFTLMTPGEVRKLFDRSEDPDDAVDEGAKPRAAPAAHMRRRHFRTLRDDRFVNAKGKVIEVKAAWVGPEEHVANGKRYRVRLDL